MTNTKQFTHCVLPRVLQRAVMTDDKRATCRLNCVMHVVDVLRQINNTQQLSVGHVVLVKVTR